MLRGRGQAGRRPACGCGGRSARSSSTAPLRDQLGLRRARLVYTGGAPLGPDTFRFFRAIGVNLKQVYGATELAGLCSAQPDGEVDPETVGRGLSRASRSGSPTTARCWSRSAGVFQGYYKQPEATPRGADRGRLAADRRRRLSSTGAAIWSSSIGPSDVGKLADGTALAPQFIENKLKFSPYIGEAVVFGDGRPFVAAIVAIDAATVGNWAERQNLAYTSFQDLAAREGSNT